MSEKAAALFAESVFHKEGMVEDDGLRNEDLFVDFSDNSEADIDQELEKAK